MSKIEVRVEIDGEDVFARFADGVCLVPTAVERTKVLAALSECMVLLTGPIARLEAEAMATPDEPRPRLRLVR